MRLESLLSLWHLVAKRRVIVINAQVNELVLHLVHDQLALRLELLLQLGHVIRIHWGSVVI